MIPEHHNLAVLLEDVIDTIMNHVEDENERYDIYDDLIQPFEAAGLEDFSLALGFDPIFDKVFVDHYPELLNKET